MFLQTATDRTIPGGLAQAVDVLLDQVAAPLQIGHLVVDILQTLFGQFAGALNVTVGMLETITPPPTLIVAVTVLAPGCVAVSELVKTPAPLLIPELGVKLAPAPLVLRVTI